MRLALLVLPIALLLGACNPATLAAFTAVGATGLAVNKYNYEQETGEKLDDPKEIADTIVDGVTDGYKQEGNTSLELNQ